LEELKESMNDMVLVDGIPAIYFLHYIPEDELIEFVYRILNLFAPRIILGISDMLTPDGDIERVKIVRDIVSSYRI